MPVITPETVQVFDILASDTPCGPARGLRFSDTGGLTQFGAFVELLPPGSRSSLCHWHSDEDEFVYMLAGEVTLWEGGIARVLRPGEAACFRAGDPVGHYLRNDSAAEARYLVVGTRAAADSVTYPDHDRVCHRAADGTVHFKTRDGQEGVESPYLLPGA